MSQPRTRGNRLTTAPLPPDGLAIAHFAGMGARGHDSWFCASLLLFYGRFGGSRSVKNSNARGALTRPSRKQVRFRVSGSAFQPWPLQA